MRPRYSVPSTHHHVVLGIGGEHHHLGAGHGLEHPAERLEAVHPRHRDVHEHDVRVLLDGISNRLLAVRGGADNLDVGGPVEEGRQPSPHQRVVIDNEHSNGSGLRNVHSRGPA